MRQIILCFFLLPLLFSFTRKGHDNPPCKLSEYDAIFVRNDAIVLAHREVSHDTSAYYNELFIPEQLISEYESALKKVYCAFSDTVNNGSKNHFWESYRTNYFYYAELILPQEDSATNGGKPLADEAAQNILHKNHLDPAKVLPDFFTLGKLNLVYSSRFHAINHNALERSLKRAGSRDSIAVPGNVMETDDDMWSVARKPGGHEVYFKSSGITSRTSAHVTMTTSVRTFYVPDEGDVQYIGYRQQATEEVEVH
jgi:hypothetical protein